MKTMVHHTIRGEYDPRNAERYIQIQKNFIPQLATYMEPIKVYNDSYEGSIFCLKVDDTTKTTVPPSMTGGASVVNCGFGRQAGR